MALRHGIRHNLPANREHSKGARARSRKEAFGIYRPLTEESADRVRSVLKVGKQAVRQYLDEVRPSGNYSELVIPGQPSVRERRLGATFVQEQKVKAAIRQGSNLWQTFERGRLVSELEHHKTRDEAVLDIPLTGFAWFGKSRRKLVGLLESHSAGMTELINEAKMVEDLLTEVGGKRIEVLIPDHVTVAEYGNRRDGQPLSVDQRHEIESLMHDHFQEAGVVSAALGGLVLNEGNAWGTA